MFAYIAGGAGFDILFSVAATAAVVFHHLYIGQHRYGLFILGSHPRVDFVFLPVPNVLTLPLLLLCSTTCTQGYTGTVCFVVTPMLLSCFYGCLMYYHSHACTATTNFPLGIIPIDHGQ